MGLILEVSHIEFSTVGGAAQPTGDERLWSRWAWPGEARNH